MGQRKPNEELCCLSISSKCPAVWSSPRSWYSASASPRDWVFLMGGIALTRSSALRFPFGFYMVLYLFDSTATESLSGERSGPVLGQVHFSGEVLGSVCQNVLASSNSLQRFDQDFAESLRVRGKVIGAEVPRKEESRKAYWARGCFWGDSAKSKRWGGLSWCRGFSYYSAQLLFVDEFRLGKGLRSSDTWRPRVRLWNGRKGSLKWPVVLTTLQNEVSIFRDSLRILCPKMHCLRTYGKVGYPLHLIAPFSPWVHLLQEDVLILQMAQLGAVALLQHPTLWALLKATHSDHVQITLLKELQLNQECRDSKWTSFV